MKIEIVETNFKQLGQHVKNEEGLVILGAGAPLVDWIEGIQNLLFDEKISQEKEVFKSAYSLQTTGGRTDLVLVLKANAVRIGALAMWRLRFNSCSWISDYLINYSDQH